MTDKEKSNWFNRLINFIIKLLSRKKQQDSDLIEGQKDQELKENVTREKLEVSQQQRGSKVVDDEKPRFNLSSTDQAPSSISGKQKVSSETEKQFRSQTHKSSKEFRVPILKALVNLGGSAKRQIVFQELEKIMGDRLTENDRKPLPSNPRITRWQRIATNSRTSMRKDGFMSVDPKMGIWIITQKGRTFLDESEEKV